MIIPLDTGQLVQHISLNKVVDSFYVTDIPLCVNHIAELATVYLNCPVLMIIP